MRSFRIKICGVTSVGDAVAAIEFGADAIGLNFYERSLRSLKPAQAAEISAALPTDTTKIGVFVNQTPAEIDSIAELAGLDVIQLHGDEPPTILRQLSAQRPVIRAVRVPSIDPNREINESELEHLVLQIQPLIANWTDAGIAGLLLDAAQSGSYGGTGSVFPWPVVPRLDVEIPLILAGGLTPETVHRAILTAHPAAVDVASGVEKSPGTKDLEKMKQFIRNAAEAFQV